MTALPPPPPLGLPAPSRVPNRRYFGDWGPGRGSFIRRLVLLEPGEGRPFAWAAAYFFFLLFSYYMLRPVRDEMGVRGDLEDLPWLWTATTIATLFVATGFAWLTANLPRRHFVPLLYRIIGVVLLGFWIVLSTIVETKSLAAGYVFFVWVSVYNLLSVSVFWGFMATIFSREQGKRLFGAIAVGGTCGAICGSFVPVTLAKTLGPVNLILIAALMLEVVAQCVIRLGKHESRKLAVTKCLNCGYQLTGLPATDGGFRVCPECGTNLPPEIEPIKPPTKEPSRNVWAGFALIAKSPYLQLMVAYMLLYTITSTFLYLEQLRIIKENVIDSAERTRLFGGIDLAVNVLTLLTQVFVTGRLLMHLGIMTGLLLLPVLTFAGFTGLYFFETVAMLMIVQILRRAMHYAVDRPTREVLYTVLGPDEKYKSKSFIDTFVYRTGDLLGAGGTAIVNATALTIGALALPAAAVWVGVGTGLGLVHRHIAGNRS